ncbi:MAG: hypothetical protein IKL07_05010, partial [Clostridium sp.]|nr:hypothetical protein [Clostridium sp.]
MRKQINRVITIGMACLLIGSSCFATLPETTIMADKKSMAKEEVAYVMANAQGAVRNVNVVNIPWNISIRYYLNGVEFSPEEIAGKSGALKIYFTVTKNEKCRETTYDNFALQAVFTLDTKLCNNIQSNDATVANIGSQKQLTYTIHPEKGIDTTITANVKNFRMAGVALNGIPLGGNSILRTGESAKVKSAIETISSSSNGGAPTSGDFSKLTDSSSAIKSDIVNLSSSTINMKDNLSYVKYTDLMARNGVDIDRLQAGNQEAIDSLTSQMKSLKSSLAQIENVAGSEQQVSQLTEQINSIQNVVHVLIGNRAALTEIESYLTGLSNTTDSLSQGLTSLKSNYETLDSTIADMTNKVEGLPIKVTQLDDGINQIFIKTDAIEAEEVNQVKVTGHEKKNL